MDEDILAILAIFLCIFTPIMGLTVRFALKPMVDSIARLLEARANAMPTANAADLHQRRMELIESEISLMRAEVQRVTEQREFMERLSLGR